MQTLEDDIPRCDCKNPSEGELIFLLQILDTLLYVGYACGVYGCETYSLSLELGRDENCVLRIMD